MRTGSRVSIHLTIFEFFNSSDTLARGCVSYNSSYPQTSQKHSTLRLTLPTSASLEGCNNIGNGG